MTKNKQERRFKFNIHRLLFIFLFFQSSCEVFDKEEEIPTYIHIEKINLTISDPNKEGSSSSKISDVWVYVNDNLIGVFELPITFPVLATGKNSIKIGAGVKNSGAVLIRTEYPFFERYVNNDLDFRKDSTITIIPTVKYSRDVNFVWMENFEDPGISIDPLSGSAPINRSQDVAKLFEGNASGSIHLTPALPNFLGLSNSSFVLPTGGDKVFLEMNYNTTTDLSVILYANTPSGADENLVLYLYPTNKTGTYEWNKIYIDLTDALNQLNTGINYKIKLSASITDDGVSDGEVLIDNLKLIHY